MDFTPAEFPTTGVSEKEFIDKMIALAKAGEDEMDQKSDLHFIRIRTSTQCRG